MTQKKMLIEADLIEVIVSIIAEPGDKLMVINGVCIGVDTSRPVQQQVKQITHQKEVRKYTRRKRPRIARDGSVTKLATKMVLERLSKTTKPLKRVHLRDEKLYSNSLLSYVLRTMMQRGEIVLNSKGHYSRATMAKAA